MSAAPVGHSWPDLLAALLRREDLTTEQAGWAMAEVMTGEASPVQLAGFLVGLRAKGESVEELRGLADVMLEHAHRIEVAGPTIDVVGTGGDRLHSVNISTMAAIVVAATGLRVVKHGNRSASSQHRVRRRARGARGVADAAHPSRSRRSPTGWASPSASPTPSTPRCATRP